MSPWPNFKIPRRTSEARAYRTHVQSNVSLVQGHCREKRYLVDRGWKPSNQHIQHQVRGNVYDLFSNTLQWMKAIGSNHIQMHAEVNLPRNHLRVFLEYSNSPRTTSGTCLVTSQAWWPDAAGQRHTRAAWQITHICVFPKIGVLQYGWFIMENLIKMDDLGYHYFRKHPYKTDPSQRFTAEEKLGANCPSPARTPIS